MSRWPTDLITEERMVEATESVSSALSTMVRIVERRSLTACSIQKIYPGLKPLASTLN